MLLADALVTTVLQDLDDSHAVHTTRDIALRALSRAQQWVALRHRLLRKTAPWQLGTNAPLSLRMDILSRSVALMSGTLNGVPLTPTPLSQLRHRDVQWLATSVPAPQLLYCIRWSYLGVYPVPTQPLTALLTFLVAPLPLLDVTQALEVPDGYGDAVAQVTTGLLLLGHERLVQEGLARIKEGLAGTAPTSLATVGARM